MTPQVSQNSFTIVLRSDAAKVEETENAWVIRKTGLTADGIQNRGRKTRDELRKTWHLANGIPFTHDHPGEEEWGLVIDRRRLAGWVENVEWLEEKGAVCGDVVLLKHPVPGLDILERNVILNRRLVTALEAGENVEVSIGFWSTDEHLTTPVDHEGVEYDRIQREIIYDHLAAVPQGACSWGAGCGLGRHQGSESKEGNSMNEPPKNQTPAPQHNCAGGDEAQRRLASALQDAAEAKKASQDLAGKLGALESNVTTLTDQGKRLAAFLDRQEAAEKARVDEKRTALAKATNRKADDPAIASMTEPALDFALDREASFRPRGDGIRTRGAVPQGYEAVKDGILQSASGFTVVNYKDALQLAQKHRGVN